MPPIWTGLDRLIRDSGSLAGRRYGLLAHGASITEDLRPAHLALAASKAGPPAALFGPEHGYYGVEQDMVASADERDPMLGVPTLSLYGESEETLKPDPAAFEGLDVLVIDLQDVGSRYYTYAATALWAAEVALASGVEAWILDRPNPLGGSAVEGCSRGEGFESFVGAFDTPVRHGLTLGELARLEGKRRGWPEEGLRVWTLGGWRRTMLWRDLGRPWLAPSPNMPTPEIALIYPGACLLEATTLSEGRGTTRPFALLGAPGIDARKLFEILEARRFAGLRFLPTYFRPQFQKHAGEVCGGVEVVITRPREVRAFRWGIELIRLVREHFPEAFAWRAEPYEFVSDRPAIDLLTGGDAYRLALEEGDSEALDAWLYTWRSDEAAFRRERQSILLYS
ncbi:MAG: DUF1343 domain-containing protein [Acidobacteriota bacterium]